jgi:predicted metal-dependent hydrolase
MLAIIFLMIKHNDKISILGEVFFVEYSDNHFLKPSVVKDGNKLVVHKSELKNDSHYKILIEWLKKHSKKVIFERVKFYSENYGFEYKRVAIKDQRSRWGSCSSRKNLNFNWRLTFAPIEVMDYVIVHELAHTKEMNHSKKFWELVSSICPNFKRCKLWLKENQRAMLAI